MSKLQPCSSCGSVEFYARDNVSMELWHADGSSISGGRLAGRILVCTQCGRIDFRVADPLAWAKRGGVTVVKAPAPMTPYR